MSYNIYTRETHFKTLLDLFQGKNPPDISKKIIEKIRNEILPDDYVDYNLMRKILKKLSYQKLYDYIPYLISEITSEPFPKLDEKVEQEFIEMFRDIQEPWKIYHKDSNRKSFLPYSYVLYNFCVIKELDNLQPSFRKLLRLPRNSGHYDEEWKYICEQLNWKFTPST